MKLAYRYCAFLRVVLTFPAIKQGFGASRIARACRTSHFQVAKKETYDSSLF